MSSTNKTSALGLSQWVLSDPFRMEDFNADNAKIDAAVAAVPYVKLLNVTTNAAPTQVDLDLSGIDLSQFSKQITLWGSSRVVNKWVKFRENGTNPELAQKNLLLLEDIMNEMRKDLGLRKTKKGNLLAFFVSDIKKAIKSMK